MGVALLLPGRHTQRSCTLQEGLQTGHLLSLLQAESAVHDISVTEQADLIAHPLNQGGLAAARGPSAEVEKSSGGAGQ